MMGAVVPGSAERAQERTLGRYEVLGEAGRGGMGRVWRARDRELDREVAIKTLHGGALADDAKRQRFHREALAAARLRHSGVVTVHEVGEHDGETFLVMEFVRGGTLAERLRGGPLPPRNAAALVRSLADAVAHAHLNGVVHRDIKPGNVLLDAGRDDEPRLADFGVAMLADGTGAALTTTLEGLGTLAYLAPEQASGRRDSQGPGTDVYGLGAVLYHCLTGRAPFVGTTPAEVLRGVLTVDPPAVRSMNPAVPVDLESVCRKCLEKRPGDRYPTAAEVRDELDRVLRGEPVRVRPPSSAERAGRWCRRHPAVAIPSILALGAICTGLAGITWQWRRAEASNAQLTGQLARAGNIEAAALFEDGAVRDAVAMLAANLRAHPADRHAAERLVAAVTQRRWARPVALLGPGSESALRTAWSRDGRTVVTADPAGRLRFWNAADGQADGPAWAPLGPPSWMACPGITPHVAVLTEPGRLHVGPLGSPGPAWSAGADAGPVLAVVPIPGTDRIAVGGPGSRIEVRALDDGRILHRWTAGGTIRDLDASDDGRWLAVVHSAPGLDVFDMESGSEAPGVALDRPGVSGIRWSADMKRLVVSDSSEGVAFLVEWPAGVVRPPVRHESSVPAAFDEHGNLVRCPQRSRGVSVSRSDSSASIRAWTAAVRTPRDFHITPTRRHLLLMSQGQKAMPIALVDPEPLAEPLPAPAGLEGLALRSDARRLVVATSSSPPVVWAIDTDLNGGQRIDFLGGILALAFSPDSRSVLTCDQGGLVRDLDLTDPGEPGARILPSIRLDAAAFSPDAETLATASEAGDLELVEVRSGLRLGGPWSLGGRAGVIDFSEDGLWVAAGLTNGSVAVLEVSTGTLRRRSHDGPTAASDAAGNAVRFLRHIPGTRRWAVVRDGDGLRIHAWPDLRDDVHHRSGDAVTAIDVTGDGSRIAVGDASGEVCLLDPVSGHPPRTVVTHETALAALHFAAGGSGLITAGGTGSVMLWESLSGRLTGRDRIAGAPTGLHRRPDGRAFAVVAGDRGSRVYDLGLGLPLSDRIRTPRSVDRVRFSPDGRWVAYWRHRGDSALYPVRIPPPGPVPAWFPALAESMALLRREVGGRREEVSVHESLETWRRLEEVVEEDPFWDELRRDLLSRGG